MMSSKPKKRERKIGENPKGFMVSRITPTEIQKIEKTQSTEFCDQYFGKIILLIEDIKRNPFKGLGKPEPLKLEFPPCWSRRINKKDRLVYRIKKDQIEII